MICTRCGAENAASSSFCSLCGSGLTVGDSVICPHCGASNARDDSFCVACGQALVMAEAPVPPRNTSPLVWIIGGVVVTALALICLGGAGAVVVARGGLGIGGKLSPTAASAAVQVATQQPGVSATATSPVPAGRAAPTATAAPIASATPVPPAAPTTAPATSTPRPVAPTATPKPPTPTPRLPTADAAAIQREQNALAVHPGYKKYQHAGTDMAVNIPSDWQLLAGTAQSDLIELGNRAAAIRMIVELSEPGQRPADVVNDWLTRVGGRVVLAPTKTAMGHYEARQAVMDFDVPYPRRMYGIAISTPSGTYLVIVDARAGDLDADIDFEAAVASFRTPARCGTAVCADLLPLDAIVGQPVPLPPLPTPAAR